MAGLLKGAYSLARSHYCPTRELLAARLPAWPVSLLIIQPGPSGLLQTAHVDARLSADTCSTQATIQQDSQPQASHSTKPPSSRITGTRHVPGENKTFILGPGDRNQLKNIKIIKRTIKPSLSREISGNNRLLRFKNTYYIVT